jgi:hypothetical protein
VITMARSSVLRDWARSCRIAVLIFALVIVNWMIT